MSEFRSQVSIASDHPCLAGHFPGRPIVPGVLVLEMVAEAVQQWRGADTIVSEFISVKFVSPLQAAQCMDIVLSAVDNDTGRLRFRCECDGRLLAQGSLAT